MSTLETAAVVEATAIAIGLLVVIAGAVFAGVQLKADAKARRLQTIMAVLSDVRPLEVGLAVQRLQQLPDGFEFASLFEEQRADVLMVVQSYARLGNLLAAGHVRDEDIFVHHGLSRQAIIVWEKIKHTHRDPNSPLGGGFPSGIELVAARAQAYMLSSRGYTQFATIPLFDADTEALADLRQRVSQARGTA